MPILEMWVLISVGSQIGVLATIFLVFLTAVIGIALLKYQGMKTLLSAQSKLRSNTIPIEEIADGVFFAVAGALLLTPGFVTDAIGFACLTPGIRTRVFQFLRRSVFANARMFTGAQRPHSSNSPRDNVIEGEYKRDKE